MHDRSLDLTRYLLLLVGAALTAVGVIFVHSTTASEGGSFPSAGASKHLLRVLVGVVALVVVTRLDYRLVGRHAGLLYGLVMALLVLLLFLKATSWIPLPVFQLQPSEFMKLALIIGLAHYLRFRSDQRRLEGLLQPYLLTFVPMALVLLQPDLGTSLMFPPVLLAMLFVAGARRRYIAITLGIGLIALPTVYFLGEPYQRGRLVAFVQQQDPEVRKHEAYHLVQSEIALGNGGLWGRGLGQGTQNTFSFLPVKHTDFIFSIIGEEWGFVGTSSVTLLFVLLVFLCLRVALFTREPFGRLIATGVGVAFAVQGFQNMGMTMGLTPITGLPLPFVSYGGSSLVSSCLSLGLVVAVASCRVRVVASKDLDPPEIPRIVEVVDDRPAGALVARWPT